MGAEPAPTWAPSLPPGLAARALQVSLDVARRLRDRDRVGLAIAAAPGQTAFPLAVHWQAPTLAQGDAGLALGDAQKLLLHFVKPRRDAVVPFWME